MTFPHLVPSACASFIPLESNQKSDAAEGEVAGEDDSFGFDFPNTRTCSGLCGL